MGTDTDNAENKAAQVRIRARYGGMAFIGFTALVLLLDVAVNAIMARVATSKTWAAWGNIGQAFESVAAIFSALGFAALVVTFLMQFKELQMQRHELESQRNEMSKSQSALSTSAEADLRMLHLQLLKISLVDPDLMDVWPQLVEGMSNSEAKRFAYANLIIQHHALMLHLGILKDEAFERSIRYLFRSPTIRAFWSSRQPARDEVTVPDTPEWYFYQAVDQVYRDFVTPPDAAEAI